MPDGLRPPYDANDGSTCSCMLAALPLVEYRFAKAGWVQEDFSGLVFQWSGRSDVSASANTHKSGAVFDVAYSLVDHDAKLRTWQETGFTPFARVPPKFPYHGHNLLNGCPHLDPTAAAQITAYRNGRDGLVSNGPYPGPTNVPFRTWQQAQVIYADLIEEMLMPTTAEIARSVLNDELLDAPSWASKPGDRKWSLEEYVEALAIIAHQSRTKLERVESDQDNLATSITALNGNVTGLRAEVKALAANLVQ